MKKIKYEHGRFSNRSRRSIAARIFTSNPYGDYIAMPLHPHDKKVLGQYYDLPLLVKLSPLSIDGDLTTAYATLQEGDVINFRIGGLTTSRNVSYILGYFGGKRDGKSSDDSLEQRL